MTKEERVRNEMIERENKVNKLYQIGNVEFTFSEFEVMYLKLRNLFKFPYEAIAEEKIKYIEQLSYLKKEELRLTCLDSICMGDYVQCNSKDMGEYQQLIDGEWVDIELDELEVSVKIVLSILWMKGQSKEYYQKDLYTIRKYTSDHYSPLRQVKLFRVLEAMEIIEQYYPPIECTGRACYVSLAIVNGEKIDITGQQNHLISRV